MVTIEQTNHQDEGFLSLVARLDVELLAQYGDLQRQYSRHNAVNGLLLVVVARMDDVPAACGAIRQHNAGSVEIKRMFVAPEHRRQGLARQVLAELESAARSLGYGRAVLETGIKQVEAIGLYQSMGYQIIENYGPYVGNENSVCMGKKL